MLLLCYIGLLLYAVMLYQYQPVNKIKQNHFQPTRHVLAERTNTFSNLTNLFGVPEQAINLYKPTSWKLTGIIVQDNGKPYVIINLENKDKIFFEGDKIDVYTVVEKIEKEMIIIRHQNKKKMITLFQSS